VVTAVTVCGVKGLVIGLKYPRAALAVRERISQADGATCKPGSLCKLHVSGFRAADPVPAQRFVSIRWISFTRICEMSKVSSSSRSLEMELF
jgi:hypothetical protein